MKALLLAAGLGTRLRPITDRIPKCMVPIAGRPLLAYWLELLFERAGIEQVVINTHYLPGPVEAFCKESPYCDRVILVHEEDLLGTAGTLKAQSERLAGGEVLVAHADNLTLFDPQAFLARHRERPRRCVLTMMTFETDDPSRCGIVELSPLGVVTAFHEKVSNPPGRLANAAVYLFSPEALGMISQMPQARSGGQQALDISLDLIPRLIGRITTYHNGLYHRDIGHPQSLEAAQVEFPPLYSLFSAPLNSQHSPIT
jgi:mannose-1-phosphate guanylyltransferase